MTEDIRFRTSIDIDRTSSRDKDSLLWQSLAAALRGIPDYEDPPCKGQHPLFDFPDPTDGHEAFRSPQADSAARALYRQMRQPHLARMYYTAALALCDTCPLRGLTGRCANDARDADRRFSGVAGGWVFVEGQPICSSSATYRAGDIVPDPPEPDIDLTDVEVAS